MFQKLVRSLQRNLFGKDPDYHDPYDDPAEQFYARIYLKYLFEKLDVGFRHQRLKILDVGCHTGRLSIPLAKAGHQVTGIDTSRFHIKLAHRHAREAGVQGHFFKGDGLAYSRRKASGDFDVVLCTEVLYQFPDYRERIKDLFQMVRPGGLLATSHRTRFFYLSGAIREKNFQMADLILNNTEGHLWGSYFNWQTPSMLKDLYQNLGAEVLMVRPIGIFTGNGKDGMAALCDLGEMSDSERDALFEVEAQDTDEFSANGRYLFIIGRKKEN